MISSSLTMLRLILLRILLRIDVKPEAPVIVYDCRRFSLRIINKKGD